MSEVFLTLLLVMKDGSQVYKEVKVPSQEECRFTANQMHKDGFVRFTNAKNVKFLRLYTECVTIETNTTEGS